MTLSMPSLPTADLLALAEMCAPPAAKMSMYDAIGGRPALVAAVDGLFERLLADPELAQFFPDGAGDLHRRFVVTMLCEALGGPQRYRGPGLAESHRDMGITDAHFDRTAAHLAATLDELGVPADLAGRVIEVVAGLRQAVVTA